MTVEEFIKEFTPPADFDRHLRHLYDVWDKDIIELDAVQRVSEDTKIPIVDIAIMCINENVLKKMDEFFFTDLIST